MIAPVFTAVLVILIFSVSCTFPAALIDAVRAEDPEKARRYKLWASVSFGLVVVVIFFALTIF